MTTGDPADSRAVPTEALELRRIGSDTSAATTAARTTRRSGIGSFFWFQFPATSLDRGRGLRRFAFRRGYRLQLDRGRQLRMRRLGPLGDVSALTLGGGGIGQ